MSCIHERAGDIVVIRLSRVLFYLRLRAFYPFPSGLYCCQRYFAARPATSGFPFPSPLLASLRHPRRQVTHLPPCRCVKSVRNDPSRRPGFHPRLRPATHPTVSAAPRTLLQQLLEAISLYDLPFFLSLSSLLLLLRPYFLTPHFLFPCSVYSFFFLPFYSVSLSLPAPTVRLRRETTEMSLLHASSIPCASISYKRSPANRRCAVSTRHQIFASLSDPEGAKLEYTPWLIVGLGNPGNKYHGTRHNVGFEMIDRISQTEGISMNTIQSKALVGIGSIGEVPILLAKPQAYMNFSGESVGPLASYYQVPLRHILVAYDEMSLPNGVMRLQPKGGHGHHNGLKSVIDHLDSCRSFPRLCIGVGNPPGTMDMKAFLLQKFSSQELGQIDAALEQGAHAVRTLVLNGFDTQIDRFNLSQKYKYHKV